MIKKKTFKYINKGNKKFIFLKESQKIHDSLKARKKKKGFKKFSKEIIQGWFPNQITKDNEYGVLKTRVIDKENNSYFEKVFDLKIKKCIRYCQEKLSDHHRKNKKYGKN